MRKVLPVAGRHQFGHFMAGLRLLPVSGETDVLSQELRITAGRSTEDGRLEGVTRQCLSPHCAQRPAPLSAIGGGMIQSVFGYSSVAMATVSRKLKLCSRETIR